MRDDEWGGSFLQPDPLPGRDRAPHARRGRARTSSSSTACRCSTWSRAAAPGTRSSPLAQAVEAAGATIINTGIGWHEARIPTIATMVPRAAFTWVTRRLKGAVKIPLITTNRINDPADRRGDARARRRRHGVDGASVSRRRRVRRTRRRRAAPTRSTPASAATRRASIRSSSARSRPAWSIRSRAARPSWISRRHAAKRKVAVVGAGPAGHGLRRDRGRARPRRDAVRSRGRDRRAVQSRAAHSRQGGVRRDAALFPHAARPHSAPRSSLNRRVGAEDLRGVRRGDSRHRRRAAHAGDSRHRLIPRSRATSRSSKGARTPASASPSSAPAASASTSRNF